ncbi:hypothetical protein R4Z09_03780 [Niallia oryzisoli]|uniref:Uncharacterized protein n=1 Tax=Niallia oryzisoli TaxID=1737571 RepID=A0ABZ2CEF6_9BACI
MNQDTGNKDSSLYLTWQQVQQELDNWNERTTDREEMFLQSSRHFIDNVKRSQDNVKELVNHFSKEQRELERMVHEEFLTATTWMHYFFPVQSYEEMNRVFNNSQKSDKMSVFTNCESLEQYMESVERFVELRRNRRNQFVASLKETAKVIYESQRNIVQLITNQLKSVFFPIQSYIESSSADNITDKK